MKPLLDRLPAVIAIIAGAYLLLSKTAAPDSYLQVIAHGIGGYMIAKGLWMGKTAVDLDALKQRFAPDKPEPKPVPREI